MQKFTNKGVRVFQSACVKASLSEKQYVTALVGHWDTTSDFSRVPGKNDVSLHVHIGRLTADEFARSPCFLFFSGVVGSVLQDQTSTLSSSMAARHRLVNFTHNQQSPSFDVAIRTRSASSPARLAKMGYGVQHRSAQRSCGASARHRDGCASEVGWCHIATHTATQMEPRTHSHRSHPLSCSRTHTLTHTLRMHIYALVCRHIHACTYPCTNRHWREFVGQVLVKRVVVKVRADEVREVSK